MVGEIAAVAFSSKNRFIVEANDSGPNRADEITSYPANGHRSSIQLPLKESLALLASVLGNKSDQFSCIQPRIYNCFGHLLSLVLQPINKCLITITQSSAIIQMSKWKNWAAIKNSEVIIKR